MFRQLLEIPNLLSISRVFIALVMIYFLAQTGNQAIWICAILMLTAAISDGLDGYLARRMNKITKLGILIDPLADKIFAIILVIGLIIYREFPLWMAFVIVGRDLLIIVAGALLFKDQEIAVPSNLSGKYAFAAIAFLLGSYVINYEFGIILSTYFTLFFVAMSLYNYVRTFIYVKKYSKSPVFKDRRLYVHLRIAFQISYTIVYFYPLVRSIF